MIDTMSYTEAVETCNTEAEHGETYAESPGCRMSGGHMMSDMDAVISDSDVDTECPCSSAPTACTDCAAADEEA